MNIIYAAVAVAAVIAAAGRLSRKYSSGAPRRRLKSLKSQYCGLSGMPEHLAEESLRQQVEALRKKFPAKDREWYIEKALYDLQRDRGR